jgi:SAM-dependent methyltransferase
MSLWHEDDRFWELFYHFLFPQERWSGTAAEIDLLLERIAPAPGAAVLDLGCGPGRHSLELARRGCRVTGVDRTALYLEKARQQAQEEGLDVRFVEADMRHFVRPGVYDLALNLYTTFGYFVAAEENIQVLRNVYDSLKPGGILVMEMSGKEVIARSFRERDWREHEGVIMLEERSVVEDWSQMENRWTIIDGADRYSYTLRHWTYSAAELKGMLMEAGFDPVTTADGLGGGPYDQHASRLTAVAVRPQPPF